MPTKPFAYTILKYRERMGMTLEQVKAMPMSDLLADLEMMDLEAEHGPSNAKPPIPDQPKMS